MVGTYVGYGIGGDGLTGGLAGTDKVKRAGWNHIAQAGGNLLGTTFTNRVLLADFDKPDSPLSTVADPAYSTFSGQLQTREYMIATGDSGGGMFIDVGGQTYLAAVHSAGLGFDPGGSNGISFDYGDILVSTRVEPALSWIPNHVNLGGDLNNDDFVNALDIDTLYAIEPNTVPPANAKFDLDGNALVNLADVDLLVNNIFGTEYGDANLDGMINLTDFNALAANFKQVGGWAQGDFNGSGFIDMDDFNILSLNFGFGVSEDLGELSLLALPEPASIALLGLGAVALLRRR